MIDVRTSNWRQVVKAYQANIARVRNVFDDFFTPGLISRLCVELNTTGRFDCCETSAQWNALNAALNGNDAVYDAESDCELFAS